MPSLVTEYSINLLLNNQFTEVLKQDYSSDTTSDDILSISNGCSSYTLLCVGSVKKGYDSFEVLACGNCFAITTETEWNKPIFNGNAYWYFTPGYSFGFSSDKIIYQVTADDSDYNNMYKLSWNLDNKEGRVGDRSGNNLISDDSRIKYIFMKNGNPGKKNLSLHI